MKILCICNDYYHPGSVVEEGLHFLNADNQIDFESLSDPEKDLSLEDYSLIILSKANMKSDDPQKTWLTNSWEQAISGFVERGGDLLVLHSGIAGYGDNKNMRKLMGGSFIDHPDQCSVKYLPENNKEIMNGIQAFECLDEHYFVETDKDVEIFLSSSSKHGIQPAGWICRKGNGEVIVLTPGHNIDVWINENYRQLLTNILLRIENE